MPGPAGDDGHWQSCFQVQPAATQHMAAHHTVRCVKHALTAGCHSKHILVCTSCSTYHNLQSLQVQLAAAQHTCTCDTHITPAKLVSSKPWCQTGTAALQQSILLTPADLGTPHRMHCATTSHAQLHHAANDFRAVARGHTQMKPCCWARNPLQVLNSHVPLSPLAVQRPPGSSPACGAAHQLEGSTSFNFHSALVLIPL